MLAVSNAFNEAFKEYDRDVKMRIKIKDVTYTDSDIISFNYNSGSIVGESFAIGSTFANTIKLTLCKIVEGLKQLDEVIPEMGIVVPSGSIEWVKLGTFIISEEVNPDRNENRTSIECTDKMIMLDDPYESKLKYPAKIRDVALEIANLAGVEVDKVSFGRLMENNIQKPTGYTFRQALGLIAQFEAGYACFDRNGLLAIRTLEDKNYEVIPKAYFQKGLVKNELMFRPAGIQVKINGESEDDKVLKIGNEKGSVIKLENRVMTEQLLRLVYDKVKTINYYPYSLNWRGNPAVEVGDWLRVTDLKGNKFKIPNLSYSLEYKGGLTATSTVESVASNEVRFGYKTILEQTVEYVENAIKNVDGNVIYYGVEEPPNPKEGDTWFKYVDSDTEIWVYEKVGEPDIFDWVFKISSAVDSSIKEAIDNLEQLSKDNQEKSEQALVDAELAREEAKKAREDAFDSSVIARNAEKDALVAMAKGDSNSTEIKNLDGQQKLTNIKVEDNTAQISTLKSDSERLSSTIGKVEADLSKVSSGTTNLLKNPIYNMYNRLNFVLATGTKKIIDYNCPESKAMEVMVTSKTGEYLWYYSGFKGSPVKKLLKRQQYTISFIISSEREGIISRATLNQAVTDKFILGKTTNEPRMMSVTFTPLVDSYKADNMNLHIFANAEFDAMNVNNLFTIHSFMLSEGSIPSGFNFAIEDMTTKSEFTTFEQTSKGFQQTAESDITNLKSEQTQMAGQITNVVRTQQDVDSEEKVLNSNFENDEINKPPLFWATNNGERAVVVHNPDTVVGDNKSNKVLRIIGNKDTHINVVSDEIKVTPNATYKTGMKVRWGGAGNRGGTIHYTLQFLDVNKNILTTINTISDTNITAWRQIRGLDVKAPNNAYYAKIWINNKFNPQAVWVDDISLQKIITSEDIDGTIASKSEVTQLADQHDITVTKVETIDGTVSRQQGQITTLSNNINLKVDKDNAIAQINLSPEQIRLDAKFIHLSGETLIDDAIITNAMIKDVSADKMKVGTLDADNVNIINLNADNIVTGDLRGISLTSIDNQGYFNVRGNKAVLQNTSNNRSVELDDTGVYIYNANGTLRGQFNQSVVNTGIVGTNTYNVYIGTGGVDGTEGEAQGGELRIVRYDSTPGDGIASNYRYRPVRAEGFVGNYVNVNTPLNGPSHLYLRPRYGSGEVRVTASGTTDYYHDLRVRGLYANTLDINSTLTGEHIYIRPSTTGEVRFTRTNTNDVLSNFRGALGFVESLSQSKGTNFYIGTDGEVRITSKGLATTGSVYYRDIRAANFINNSAAASKQDINEYQTSALDVIDAATIYQYKLRSEAAELLEREHIGLVIGEGYSTPDEIISGNGINQYAMSSIAWKAIQELNNKIRLLEERLEHANVA